ncbi:DUF4422 domain-containing protein [Lactobacillus sp. 3B(2020)]|uniref:DUF4422 domain-containing protein n=1 Tax=Lactobacillus sp. 3B(2020) TaxID=2695882 RepID=UPI0015E02AAA|nr:DUF4422 domain-containing protein [Lactobacillus sp. 3B(2020)]QLL71016.1 DUF4422 domain-containing protein [Lactobacillus sp. 3B(2020)]
MNTVILIAAHKKVQLPNKEGYLPVLVGADKNYRADIDYQPDNDGNNISSKNPNYNELTAVYWAWKNLSADAIGLVHYRRFFFSSRPYSIENVIDINRINKLLETNDVILPKIRHYYIENNENHYIHAHEQEPLELTRKIINRNYPDYELAFEKVMKKTSAHMFNMFVMKKEAFNSYCTFVFSVLEELENQLDISMYSPQEQRVYGYIAELLMDVWINSNDITYTELPWGQIGPSKFFNKAIAMVMRKIGIKTKTHF